MPRLPVSPTCRRSAVTETVGCGYPPPPRLAPSCSSCAHGLCRVTQGRGFECRHPLCPPVSRPRPRQARAGDGESHGTHGTRKRTKWRALFHFPRREQRGAGGLCGSIVTLWRGRLRSGMDAKLAILLPCRRLLTLNQPSGEGLGRSFQPRGPSFRREGER